MIESLEKFFYWFNGALLQAEAAELVQLRGAVDERTLMTTSDDLLTGVEVLGARKLIGFAEFNRQADALAEKLAQVMRSGNGKQHSVGVSFRSSPHSVMRVLDDLITPGRKTAHRLGVTEMDYFDDLARALAKVCSEESVYLVLLTHRAGLTAPERKRAIEWSMEAGAKASKATKSVGGSKIDLSFGQGIKTPVPALFPRHESMVGNLVKELSADIQSNGVGLMLRVMSARDTVAMMRRHVDATDFGVSWRPRLIGDPGSTSAISAPRKGDQSHLVPPPIGRQLFPARLNEVFGDAELVQSAGVWYGSIIMEIVPEFDEDLSTRRGEFASLAKRIGREIPWTLSMDVSPNGEQLRKVDQFYAGMVGGFGDQNKRIRDAWEQIKRRQRDGDYQAGIRAVFTTWGGTEREALDRLSFLRSSLESWDSAVVTNETGEPSAALVASAAGLYKRSPAPYMAGPIRALARMLPLFRPASVWQSGQLLAHTREGRPYPVAFGSPEQAFWGTLGLAPSGSGKSFTLAMMNFGILMSAGLNEIPPLVTIDVGPGSSAVLKLVKNILPERLRHQVAWFRVRNDQRYTVNPFDVAPGCDEPTEVDRDFQIAVLTTVCPSLGPEGDKFCSQVIKEAYRRLSRNSPECRVWQSSYDPELDRQLHELGFPFSDRTRVWDIADWLFEHGHVEMAIRAHRFAMPRLGDMVGAAQSRAIQDLYGGDEPARTPSGESMIQVFMRSISSAQSEYQLIAGFTRFDVGNARAIAIDLEEVVGSMNSEEGRRRSAIMFLFARRLGAKNYFMRWDELRDIVPPLWSDWHEDRIKRYGEQIKFLQYDEKHYTTGIASVDKQIEVDLRVGRKYLVVTMMFSQNLADFPPAAVSNCYTYLVMGKSDKVGSQALQDTFGLSESECYAIDSECTRPGVMFAYFRTKAGDTSQILYNTAGPFMTWAFTTDKVCVDLRTELEKRLPYLDVLRALAKVFPSGSCATEMTLYRRMRREDDPDKRLEAEIFADKVMAEIARAR